MEAQKGGMNEEEAYEFHVWMLKGMTMWVATSVVAHFLVWSWRPWF